MTDEQIEQALKVCEAATPGPWSYITVSDDTYGKWWACGPEHDPEDFVEDDAEDGPLERARLDADFIAAAADPATGYAAALREVLRLRAYIFDAGGGERDLLALLDSYHDQIMELERPHNKLCEACAAMERNS